ncbi:MAG TPA: maleylacetoacetate isomerase [Aeromonadales bacterium]|nr:maleylacetoacetate isomerase [Aeromonadales bacterium]
MLKLYGYWRSTAAYRVRIALAIKQIDYENISVHLVRDGGQQYQADYQQINAMQLVPTLVDGDLQLSESMAIVEYLEEKYPDRRLLPENPVIRAKVRELMQTVACDIHPLNNLRVLQYLKAEMAQPQSAVDDWYHHWIHLGFSAIENKLTTTAGDFCFANELTLADVFLVAQVYNAHRFEVDLEKYPLINAINARCLELNAFQEAIPESQPDATN